LLFIVMVHVEPFPLQAPLQLLCDDPLPTVAVSVTLVPWLKVALQVLGQFIPFGLLVTLPLPETLTVRVAFCGGGGGDPPLPPLLPLTP
jgi:hypothetical protein